MQLPTLVRRYRNPRRNNYAHLRENRCDIRCRWRNRGQQHCPSRSVVRLSPLSPLRLSSSPPSPLCLLSSPPSSSPLVSLLKETNLDKKAQLHKRKAPRASRGALALATEHIRNV